jgi:hypothetical protein
MTPDILNKESFPFLEDHQRANLLRLMTDHQPEKRRWMLHEVCNQISTSPPVALRVMEIMDAMGIARLELLTYHCENIPILATRVIDGFPSFPIECEHCQSDDLSSADVRFDFRIEILTSVEHGQ